MASLLIRLISLGLLLFLAIPLAVIVGASLTDTSYLVFPPESWTLRWYATVLTDPSYVSSFAVSTVLAACATILAVVLAVPAALAVARHDFRGRDTLAAMFAAPMVLPYLVLGSALLQFTSYLGFSQTFWALLVGHLLIVTPFVFKALAGLMTPETIQLERASADLGADPWTTFRLVTLPLLKPGIISGAIFGFIISWINVELSMFNTTAVMNTIPVLLFNYVQYSVDPSIAAVSAITIFVSILVIVILDIVVGLDVFSDKHRSG